MTRAWADQPLEARKALFLARVVAGAAGCWVWTGHVMPNGYGTVSVGQRTRTGQHRPSLAHRVAYELYFGAIPGGMSLDHLCRNRRCVNPAHLEPVTTAENNQRGKSLITECVRGHPYSPENTYVTPRGHRQCLTCRRASDRRRYPRRAHAASHNEVRNP